MPWWAARTRVPGAPGRIQDRDGDLGREDLPTARRRSGPRVAGTPQGPGDSRTPARQRPAARPRPPCASPPLVSTPMALPAPVVRSFSRSTLAMVAPTLPRSLSCPAPPLSPSPPRALRSAPRRVRSPQSTPGAAGEEGGAVEAGAGPTCPCGCLRSRRAPHHPPLPDPTPPHPTPLLGGGTGVFSDQVVNLFSLTRSAFIEGGGRWPSRSVGHHLRQSWSSTLTGPEGSPTCPFANRCLPCFSQEFVILGARLFQVCSLQESRESYAPTWRGARLSHEELSGKPASVHSFTYPVTGNVSWTLGNLAPQAALSWVRTAGATKPLPWSSSSPQGGDPASHQNRLDPCPQEARSLVLNWPRLVVRTPRSWPINHGDT